MKFKAKQPASQPPLSPQVNIVYKLLNREEEEEGKLVVLSAAVKGKAGFSAYSISLTYDRVPPLLPVLS